uniref:Uncharacterized protein n=1 Tax=Catharus ustulatus TaxID=91951 RepID=A0A8C3Y842_CATUS
MNSCLLKCTDTCRILCKNKLFLFLSQILDNSQTLLDVLKEEMGDLGKAIEPQSAPLGRVRRQKRS